MTVAMQRESAWLHKWLSCFGSNQLATATQHSVHTLPSGRSEANERPVYCVDAVSGQSGAHSSGLDTSSDSTSGGSAGATSLGVASHSTQALTGQCSACCSPISGLDCPAAPAHHAHQCGADAAALGADQQPFQAWTENAAASSSTLQLMGRLATGTKPNSASLLSTEEAEAAPYVPACHSLPPAQPQAAVATASAVGATAQVAQSAAAAAAMGRASEECYEVSLAGSQTSTELEHAQNAKAPGGGATSPRGVTLSTMQRALFSAPSSATAPPLPASVTPAMVAKYGIYASLVAERRAKLGTSGSRSVRASSDAARASNGAAGALAAPTVRLPTPPASSTSVASTTVAIESGRLSMCIADVAGTTLSPAPAPVLASPVVPLGTSPPANTLVLNLPLIATSHGDVSGQARPTSPQASLQGHSTASTTPNSPLTGFADVNACAFLSALQDPMASKAAAATAAAPAARQAGQPQQPLLSSASAGKASVGGAAPLLQTTASSPSRLRHARSIDFPYSALTAVCECCGHDDSCSPSEHVCCSTACQRNSALQLGAKLVLGQHPGAEASDDATPVHTPRMSSRVESLRHKLRAQAAEIRVAVEQLQGSSVNGHSLPMHRTSLKQGLAPSAGFALAQGAKGMPLGAGLTHPALLGVGSRSLGLPVGHAASGTLYTQSSEDVNDDEEEERSRHESTLSYLRMLSRSNTSFCTRVRRSNTNTLPTGSARGNGSMDSCSNAVPATSAHRNILGMSDER